MSARLCIEYRNLNKLLILNKYPLPLMGKLRNGVAGAQVFTKHDIRDGYHVTRISKGDQPKTAFHTRY